MSARRQSGGGFHGLIAFLRRLVEAVKHARGREAAGGRQGGGGQRWPQCPACHRRTPSLCSDAEEGAEPCGYGITCCCYGPHQAPKGSRGADSGRDDGKFTTSAPKAAE